MESQHFLYLNSSNSLDFYPSNSPGRFYCKLPQSLDLKGFWECSLLQIQFVNSYFAETVPPKNFYVCTDMCKESVLFERKIPVIRRISNVSGSELLNQTIEVDIKNLIYIPIICEYTDVICIYIVDDSGDPVVFSEGPVHVTLHFRQVKAFI